MQNKRGQGLSTNAIILIVLGIVVLVVLILGFTIGWKSLLPWISTDNINTIVTQCGIACTIESTYDFCSKPLTLKADDLPEGGEEMTGNCTFFATAEGYDKYGVQDCSGLCV